MIVIRPALDTAEDIAGWPRPDADNDTVRYLQCDWAKETHKYDTVVLVIDEVNRAQNETLQALFEVLSDRTLRRKPLNPETYIVCTMNPDNGNYQVTTLDPAFERRMIRLAVEPDVDSWIEWAESNNVTRGIIDFINNNRKFLSVKEEYVIDAKPNPDCYRIVDMLLRHNVLTDDTKTAILTGVLGREATTAMLKFISTGETTIQVSTYMANPEKYKTVVCGYRNDKLAKFCDEVVDYMNELLTDKYTKEAQCADVVTTGKLCLLLPLETATALLSRVVDNPKWMETLGKSGEVALMDAIGVRLTPKK